MLPISRDSNSNVKKSFWTASLFLAYKKNQSINPSNNGSQNVHKMSYYYESPHNFSDTALSTRHKIIPYMTVILTRYTLKNKTNHKHKHHTVMTASVAKWINSSLLCSVGGGRSLYFFEGK